MGESIIQRHRDGVVVSVWVVPGARRSEVVGLHGDAIRVRIAAPPEGGKANRAVGRLLEEVTGARNAELMRGGASRRKTFLLHGVRAVDAARTLGLGDTPGPK